MSEQEIEIKLKLHNEGYYLNLVDNFLSVNSNSGLKELNQENYFFDSRSRILSKNGWAFRLRIENGKAIITAKGVTSKSGSAAIRDEINLEVAGEVLHKEINNNPNYIFVYTDKRFDFLQELLGERVLTELVSFKNQRSKIKFPNDKFDNLILEIDKTTFANGKIDYELEVELEKIEHLDDAEEVLKKLFSSLSIPYEVERESKFARALRISETLKY